MTKGAMLVVALLQGLRGNWCYPVYTTKPQGRGMGLAICRSILSKLGSLKQTGNNLTNSFRSSECDDARP